MISEREALSAKFGLLTPPFLRLEIEERGSDAAGNLLTGRVKKIEERAEGFVLTVVGSTEIGTVRVYLNCRAEELPETGAEVRFEGRYFLYDIQKNPGGFDVRTYYDRLGCFLAFSADAFVQQSPGNSPIVDRMVGFRHRLILSLKESAAGEEAGIFISLFPGCRDAFDRQTEDLFMISGIFTFFTLSGMYLTMVCGLFYRLIRKLTPSLVLSAVLSLIPAGGLIVLSGFSVTLIRAGAVFSLRVFAPVCKRRFDYLSAMSLTLILLMFDCPGIIYLSSFQYAAALLFSVGILMPAIFGVIRPGKRLSMSLVRLLTVQLAFLPLRLSSEGVFSLWSLPISLLAFPLSGLLFFSVVMSAFIGLFSAVGGRFFIGSAHYILVLFEALSRFSEKLPFSAVITGKPPMGRILIYSLMLCLSALVFRLIFIRRKKIPEEDERSYGDHAERMLIAALFAALMTGVWFLRYQRPADEALILQLNVGQGDSAVFLLPDGSTYLIDGGSASEAAVYDEILRPAFFALGIRHFDAVFVSHFDIDHLNGILSLLRDRRIGVGAVYLPENGEGPDNAMKTELYALAESRGIPTGLLSAGMRMNGDGYEFLCLTPEKACREIGNDASMSLAVRIFGRTLLYTGDLPGEKEPLLYRAGDVDILKCAHHGSKFSTTEALLKHITPEAALLSFGEYNSYGHPASETLERLENAGVRPYFTGGFPAVRIVISSSGDLTVGYDADRSEPSGPDRPFSAVLEKQPAVCYHRLSGARGAD